MPSSAAASPIAPWPPQPWTWTSTKPGARSGPSIASSFSLDGGDPAVLDAERAGRDPVVEDQPAADRRSRSSRRPRCAGAEVASGSVARSPARGCSAPWIAAPIAPAHVPSSAVTTSTSSSDVVWTRRRSSARIGLEEQVAGRRDRRRRSRPGPAR